MYSKDLTLILLAVIFICICYAIYCLKMGALVKSWTFWIKYFSCVIMLCFYMYVYLPKAVFFNRKKYFDCDQNE